MPTTYISKLARDTGKKIVDAKQGLMLKVNNADIAKAEQMDPSNCAFAKAAMRQFKAKSAHFFRTKAWIETPRHIVRFELPTSVQKEIVAFDRAKAAVPGTYRLSAVSKSASTAYQRAWRERDKRKNHVSKGERRRKKRFQHTTEFIRVVKKNKDS